MIGGGWSSLIGPGGLRRRPLSLVEQPAARLAQCAKVCTGAVDRFITETNYYTFLHWIGLLVIFICLKTNYIANDVRAESPSCPGSSGGPLVPGRCPVMMLRPRAWNMTDHCVAVAGTPAPAPLVGSRPLQPLHLPLTLLIPVTGTRCHFFLRSLVVMSELCRLRAAAVAHRLASAAPRGRTLLLSEQGTALKMWHHNHIMNAYLS